MYNYFLKNQQHNHLQGAPRSSSLVSPLPASSPSLSVTGAISPSSKSHHQFLHQQQQQPSAHLLNYNNIYNSNPNSSGGGFNINEHFNVPKDSKRFFVFLFPLLIYLSRYASFNRIINVHTQIRMK